MARTKARTGVILLIDHLLSGGGAQTILYDIVTLGDQERYEFSVVYWFGRSAYTEKLQSAGVPEYFLGHRGSKWLTWLHVLLPFRLVRLMRQRRPEVLHVHAFTLPLLHAVLCRLLFPGLVILYTQHISRCQCSRFWQWWQSLWMPRYHFVVTDLEQSRLEAREYGVPEARIQCIPFGVRSWPASASAVERVRREITWEPGENILLSVARLAPDRRIDIFIRALPAILAKYPRCRLVLVGGGQAQTDLRALATELGVQGSIAFLGSRADPMPYYCACDVYLTMAIGGEVGVAGWQAALCGRPVVAIVSDYLQDVASGNDRPFVAVLSAGELSEAVIALLSDPRERVRIGEQGRSVAKASHCPQAMVDRYMELYRELLAKRGGKR